MLKQITSLDLKFGCEAYYRTLRARPISFNFSSYRYKNDPGKGERLLYLGLFNFSVLYAELLYESLE